MTIAESLKRFRKNYGITQKQVADTLGIKQQSYSPYETKNVTPSASVILKLAIAYNVSSDYLLGLSDVPNPAKVEKVSSADIDDNKDLITAAENDRVLDFYENLAHKLAEQGIKI